MGTQVFRHRLAGGSDGRQAPSGEGISAAVLMSAGDGEACVARRLGAGARRSRPDAAPGTQRDGLCSEPPCSEVDGGPQHGRRAARRGAGGPDDGEWLTPATPATRCSRAVQVGKCGFMRGHSTRGAGRPPRHCEGTIQPSVVDGHPDAQ
jgi:hypothetical protein